MYKGADFWALNWDVAYLQEDLFRGVYKILMPGLG